VTEVTMRPVDIVTTLAQSHHAERVSQSQHTHPRAQQEQFTQALREVEKHRQESVAESEDGDESDRIRGDDERRDKGRQQRDQGHERRQDPPAPGPGDDGEVHLIDLRA
jgi:hypothetical protein